MAASDGGGRIVVEDGLLRAGFVQLPILLARDPNLSAGAKLVYVALLWYHWRGQDYPGQQQLAEDFGFSARSAWAYLKELEREGYLESDRPGLGQPNTLVLRTLRPASGDGQDRRLLAPAESGADPLPLQLPTEQQPRRAQPQTRKFCESGLADSAGLDPQNLRVTLEVQDSESTRTESGAAQRGASGDSDSDFVNLSLRLATALGKPKEGKQLATWAKNHGISGDALQAAFERTQQRLQEEELAKPVAYLQTVAQQLAAARQEVAEVGQRQQAEVLAWARGEARRLFADRVIGGSWRQVRSILSESIGEQAAEAVVRECELVGAPK